MMKDKLTLNDNKVQVYTKEEYERNNPPKKPISTKLGRINSEKNYYRFTYGGPITKNKELDSEDYDWFKKTHTPQQIIDFILN